MIVKEPIRLLVIDDSPQDTNYLTLFFKIKKLPVAVRFEQNPEKALSDLRQIAREEFPEVILVDINMPLMTGFEFVERLRVDFHEPLHHPLVFITSASIQIADRARAENHRFIAGFIEKPLTEEFFRQRILTVLRPA